MALIPSARGPATGVRGIPVLRNRVTQALFLSSLTILLSACSGSGGDSGVLPPAIGLSFQGAVIAATEGTLIAVPVELELLGGGILPSSISVTVTATGGSATSGADYTFSSPTVVFPASASDGTTQLALIQFLNDNQVEGTETITLSMTAMSGGAALGTIGSKAVSIVDADQAVFDFTSGSATTPNEATASYSFSVQMDLAPGDVLSTSITVQVFDNGEGNATSGADYTPIGTRNFTFVSGTPDGSIQTDSLVVLSDTLAEGTETLHIELLSGNPAGAIGTPSDHILTITDDDIAGGGLIQIEVGGSPIASGSTVALGTQSVNLGAGVVTTLTLENIGGSTLVADLPVLVSGDDREFLIEFAGSSPLPAPLPSSPTPSPLIDLDDDPTQGVSLVVDELALAGLEGKQSVLIDGVALPGGARVDLELTRLPAPWTTDAVVSIDGAIAPLDPSWIEGVSFWRGIVIGEPGSRVFLSFSERSTLGWIRTAQAAGGMAYLFPEDLDPAASGGVDARWVVAAQMPSTGKTLAENYCQALSVPAGVPSGSPAGGPATGEVGGIPPIGAVTQGGARLAIETDFQFFQIFGNTTDASTYVTQQIAAISELYVQQIHTPLVISYLGLHSNSSDGWNTPDVPGTTGQMLDEFRAAWAPSLGGSWPASADLAHFISGASLGGGIAYIDVVCNQNFGFGVSGVSGNIDWNTFTGAPNSGNFDFIVVAHEIGHNFSADHTQDYCPPIDRCRPTCLGSAICEPGTIMSYCHLCGGTANISLTFHPFLANEMRKGSNDSCVGSVIIGAGETVTYELRFDPDGSAGSRSSVLRFVHDGAGSNPFNVTLTGTAQ